LVASRPRLAGGEQQGGRQQRQDHPFHEPVSAVVSGVIVAIYQSRLKRA
jgi:hypothetical protein